MKKEAVVRLGVLSLLWGSVFLWIKIAGYGFSPVEMVLVRLVLGAGVLLALGFKRGLRLPTDRTVLGHMFVTGLLGNVIPWLLFAYGERTASSNIAGIISGTGPVWTMAAALALGSERRLGRLRALGVGVGLAGVVMVAAPWSDGTHVSVHVAIYFLLGAMSFGSSFAYMGRFLTGRGIPGLMLAGGQLGIAALITLALVPFFGLTAVHWQADSVIALIILGIVCTGFAVLLNTDIIVRDGAAAASTVIYLMTVVSVVLGAVVLGDPMGWTVLLGTVAVLAAIAFMRHKPAVAEPAQPDPAPADSDADTDTPVLAARAK
jgi:drug/metabolite transporter (DMT)-like permease